jgi:hypothetical protein
MGRLHKEVPKKEKEAKVEESEHVFRADAGLG